MMEIAPEMDLDSTSDVSFEDVGKFREPSLQSKPASRGLVTESFGVGKDIESGRVPDVLYVANYTNDSKVVETERSDKPFDASFFHRKSHSGQPQQKKPVIEIETEVQVAYHAKPAWHLASSDDDDDTASVVPTENTDRGIVDVGTTRMIIHSEHLKNALSAVVEWHPSYACVPGSFPIEEPYQVLVHHRKQLEAYKLNQPRCHDAEYAATTVKHIDVLLSFLKSTLGDQLVAEESRWNRSKGAPTVTFDLLWLLLVPGEVVYAKQHGRWRPFILRLVEKVPARNRPQACWEVQCCHCEYRAGSNMRWVANTILVDYFSGELAIQDLPVIPARFIPGGEKAAEEKEIELGQRYWGLLKGAAYREYKGPLIEQNTGVPWSVSGRVVVDFKAFARYETDNKPQQPACARQESRSVRVSVNLGFPQYLPCCACTACGRENRPKKPGRFAGLDDVNFSAEQVPRNDLAFLVCSKTVPAFVLGERRWGLVEVAELGSVKADKEAFSSLAIEGDIKQTVRALAGRIASADGKVSPWPSDLTRNKESGRIVLLHGSPGTGKTLSVECVAEYTARPLVSLTSGDIGITMDLATVESKLKFFLELAERWGAVVLLDEADVYLEERRTKDLRRNGLVSIFLRVLESYRGVLFLTTNRVEVFDPAFTSRIHVALHYRILRDEDRLRVWANSFERLDRESAGNIYINISARQYIYKSDEVQALKWNGREIRNALQTAVSLAETEALENNTEKVQLSDTHLRAVVNMSKDFKRFLYRRAGWAEDDNEGDDSSEDDASSILSD